jgi:hypothetical protein
MQIKLVLSLSLFLVFGGSSSLPTRAVAAEQSSAQNEAEIPRDVELMTAAWDAYTGRQYEDAIAKAERCASRFKSDAEQTQSDLEQKKAKRPPTGKVTEAQKKTIYALGPINSVATCYWIKGRSAQILHRNGEAVEAYNAAAKLSYGRAWDPRGWFWSPAEDSRDRLLDLK